jgi:hypothetical protein
MDRAQLDAALRKAWRDALDVEIADDSDFYALGGNSLSAAEIATRVAEGHPDVADLDLTILTAILEESRFDAVVDAVCAEIGVPQ